MSAPVTFAKKVAASDMELAATWRRRWDSNPRYLAVSQVFKTCSINPSDTSPFSNGYVHYSKKKQRCQQKKTETKPNN